MVLVSSVDVPELSVLLLSSLAPPSPEPLSELSLCISLLSFSLPWGSLPSGVVEVEVDVEVGVDVESVGPDGVPEEPPSDEAWEEDGASDGASQDSSDELSVISSEESSAEGVEEESGSL